MTPETRIPAMLDNRIDLECGSTTANAERRQRVAFSPLIFVAGTRLMVPKACAVSGITDLKGKTIVVTRGTTNEQAIQAADKKFSLGLKIVTADDHEQSYRMLADGKADAFATDDILLYGLIARHKAQDRMKVVGDLLSYEPYGIMFRKGDPQLAAVVERTFRKLATNHDLVPLYREWFMQRLPTGEQAGHRHLAAARGELQGARRAQPMTDAWPALPFDAVAARPATTLHMWTQIVGKVRLALAPHVNHWWQVPLYVSARGLTTSAIPYRDRSFEIEFDFLDHVLRSGPATATSRIADARAAIGRRLLRRVHGGARSLGLAVRIWTMPQEFADPIPFDKDTAHAAYEREPVERFWRVLRSVDAVLKEFRGGFLGKASPVHFFWGSFDLAVTRFSGRRAPPMPEGRQGHAGSLLPRGQQRRLLAGRCDHALPRLLCLRLSRAGRLRRGAGPARRGLLRQRRASSG